MPMPPIEFHVAMFRGEWDQARSQYVLLFLMEALSRVNQSLLRQNHSMIARKMIPESERYPTLYRAGIHYEREKPGQEEWPDIENMLKKKGQEFPGRWGDCEDLACYRVAELRELPEYKVDQKGLVILPEELEQINNGTIKDRKVAKTVKGGMKARPFAKWRRGPTGAFHYHALVLLPDGRIEDPSLVLGMGKEAVFAERDIARRMANHQLDPKIQFAVPPKVMVVDTESPTGYNDRQKDPKGNVGVPGAAEDFSIKDPLMESIMGALLESAQRSTKVPSYELAGEERIRWKPASQRFPQSDNPTLGDDANPALGADASPSGPAPTDSALALPSTSIPTAPASPEPSAAVAPPPASGNPTTASSQITPEMLQTVLSRLNDIEKRMDPTSVPLGNRIVSTPKLFAVRTLRNEGVRIINEIARQFGL